jgi:hypothetical protein
MHASAGFIAANHLTLPNLFPYRFGFIFCRLACSFYNRHPTPRTQLQTKQFVTNLAKSLEPNMMFVM